MSRPRLALAALVVALASPAVAQQPPAAAAAPSRCGGLLCDAYYAGRPAPAPGQPDIASPFDSLPCHDFLCRMFGGHAEAAPAPVQQAAVEPAPSEAATSPKAHHSRHRKHAKMARAETKSARSATKAGEASAQ